VRFQKTHSASGTGFSVSTLFFDIKHKLAFPSSIRTKKRPFFVCFFLVDKLEHHQNSILPTHLLPRLDNLVLPYGLCWNVFTCAFRQQYHVVPGWGMGCQFESIEDLVRHVVKMLETADAVFPQQQDGKPTENVSDPAPPKLSLISLGEAQKFAHPLFWAINLETNEVITNSVLMARIDFESKEIDSMCWAPHGWQNGKGEEIDMEAASIFLVDDQKDC
jgi:hypothetical protein